jgi:valyl-tRNA synthetase
MPFITEELWQALSDRQEGESIMISAMPEAKIFDENLLSDFETVKEIVSGVRTIRLQKNIPNKEPLEMQIVGEHNAEYNEIIKKMANLSGIAIVSDKQVTAASFLVGTTEYAIPLGNSINVEEELQKLEADLIYQQGFLASVMKKLGNEKFVANAKPEIVDNERKKQADAESKIKTLEESIAALKG